MIAVLKILGWVFATIAIAMLIPFASAVTFGEQIAVQSFLAAALVNAFIGVGLLFALGGRKTQGGRLEGLLLLCMIWFAIPVTSALPFVLAGFPSDPISAYFEAVSGFTTTGATVLSDLSSVPRSILIWRGLLQWLGGFATLLSLAVILSPLIGTDLLDRQLRQISRSIEGTERQIYEAARTLIPVYGGLTLLCFVLLLFANIPSFDAFCLSLSTISTGGFMPRSGTVALYGSPAAELILAVFMFLGAVSIVWIRALFQFRWKLVRDIREPYWIALIVIIFAVPLAGTIFLNSAEQGLRSIFHSITLGLATAASFVSTTGFAISEDTQDVIPYIVIVLVCVVGGGRFSTAGGIKLYRIFAMLVQARNELNLLIYPHGVSTTRRSMGTTEPELLQILTANFTVVIIVICVIALTLSAANIPLQAALIASIGAVSNIGPAYELVEFPNLGEIPSYGEMIPMGQLALCTGMILGRVEVLALLSILNFAYWRSK